MYPKQHEEEKSMSHTALRIRNRVSQFFAVAFTTMLLIVVAGYSPAHAAAKGPQQKSFATPDAAVKVFVDAMKSHDIQRLNSILGPHGKNIVSSGDAIADKEVRERFVKLYDEKHTIEMEKDTKATLLIGDKDWPFPIPIVKGGQRWLFDTKAGKTEILNRRIGRNELAVIKVCEAYVDAQQEFAFMDTDGDGIFEYAQKFVSSPGKKDGLFWPTKEGEKPSPLGPFAAQAKKEGYSKSSPDKPQPYYGYFYRILKGQGKNAKGGDYDYLVKDNMIGGFALVAYPAQYGSTGVMTFIVNQEGIVYQKNLGKDTTKIAEAMQIFDPDKTWMKVETQ
jgi:hypothetical protein